MSEKITEEYASLALKRFYDNSTENIQTSALVSRALTDKISTETINRKVNNQLNSIHASMFKINPSFGENSKHYGEIKKEILDVLTDYEAALTEYCDSYDVKLEDLILKKVELESNLVGKIFKEESYNTDENFKMKVKQSDKLKQSFSERAESIFKRFSTREKNQGINPYDISMMNEYRDLEREQDKYLDSNITKVHESNKTNLAEIEDLEKKIKSVTKQIEDINAKKKEAVEVAMETGDRWISATLKKPSVFTRAKTFIGNRLNTPKVVSKTVIAPLKMKVTDFRNNELAEIKKG